MNPIFLLLLLLGLLAAIVLAIYVLVRLCGNEPFRITITTTKSPDWEGDAQRYRDSMREQK